MACQGGGYNVACSMGEDVELLDVGVPSGIKPGQKLIISSKIHGIGAWYIACGNFYLKYYFDDVYIGCFQHSIQKDLTLWYEFEYTIPSGVLPGTHTIKVVEQLTGDTKIRDFVVAPLKAKAVIVSIDKPSSFTPGELFHIVSRIRNDGDTGKVFTKLIDRDTGATLRYATFDLSAGVTAANDLYVTLIQATDFHGRLEAGHVTVGSLKSQVPAGQYIKQSDGSYFEDGSDFTSVVDARKEVVVCRI